jgi:hypothetical protein
LSQKIGSVISPHFSLLHFSMGTMHLANVILLVYECTCTLLDIWYFSLQIFAIQEACWKLRVKILKKIITLTATVLFLFAFFKLILDAPCKSQFREYHCRNVQRFTVTNLFCPLIRFLNNKCLPL